LHSIDLALRERQRKQIRRTLFSFLWLSRRDSQIRDEERMRSQTATQAGSMRWCSADVKGDKRGKKVNRKHQSISKKLEKKKKEMDRLYRGWDCTQRIDTVRWYRHSDDVKTTTLFSLPRGSSSLLSCVSRVSSGSNIIPRPWCKLNIFPGLLRVLRPFFVAVVFPPSSVYDRWPL
jgi:hypothetical protein